MCEVPVVDFQEFRLGFSCGYPEDTLSCFYIDRLVARFDDFARKLQSGDS